MRILIPVLGFAASGGYRVLSYLADQWVQQGHDVAFLSPQGEDVPFFPTRARIIAVTTDGGFSEPGPANEHVRFRGLRKMQALHAGLTRIGAEYDIVLANHSLTPWCFLGTPVKKASRFYYIQAYEPDYFQTERQPGKWLAARLSYFLDFRQIANTDVYSHHQGVRPEAIIPAGIDLEIFHPRSDERDLRSADDIVIGCIGRREPFKGTPYVLAAFEELVQKDARYRLRVAYGNLPDGWSHPRAEVVIPRSDTELAAFYRGIDVLVAAGTVQHGAPHYPVMEAMASGTAVVTTGYLPASPANSWLVANRDSGAIAAAIREISTDPQRFSRTYAALNDIKAYAWPNISADMLALFQTGRNHG